MLLLIDNYDSFTYNLFQYLSELGADVEVIRNDKATVAEAGGHETRKRWSSRPDPLTPATQAYLDRRHQTLRR